MKRERAGEAGGRLEMRKERLEKKKNQNKVKQQVEERNG